MHCSPPGSPVHEIFPARILEWVVISYSRGSSWPRDRTRIYCVSCSDRQIIYHWATWEAPYYILYIYIFLVHILLYYIPDTGMYLVHVYCFDFLFFFHSEFCSFPSLKKSFSRGIVDLQCCVSFSYTAKWASYTYIHASRCFFHIGHDRALRRLPCAVQKAVIPHLFYIQ